MQDPNDCHQIDPTADQLAAIKSKPFLEEFRVGQAVIGYFFNCGLYRGPLVALEGWHEDEDGPAFGLVDESGIYPVGAAYFICEDFDFEK
jgi:hypothetical protein